MQQRNLLMFFLIAGLLTFTYWQLRLKPLANQKQDEAQVDPTVKRAEAKKQEVKAAELAAPPPITPDGKLVTLGSVEPNSEFNLQVILDPLGGGVRAVTLNKFRPADADGRPGEGDTLPLVPAAANLREPSHLLLNYAPRDIDAPDTGKIRPHDTLGRRAWSVVGVPTSDKASFSTEIDGVLVTKTYTVAPGDYHVGLQIDMRQIDSAKEPAKFRYQLTGAKGLPVEGKWYTSTFRNAMIALESKDGTISRSFEDLRQIGLWGGGDSVDRNEEKFIRYAGTVVQYFASVVVVDDQQVEGQDQKFLRRATSSLETGVARGRVKPGSLDLDDRVVLLSDDRLKETTIYLPRDASPALRAQRRALQEDALVAVIFHTLSYDEKLKQGPKVAVEINAGLAGQATHSLWEDDITVRLSSEPIELRPGRTTSHRYLLYNGPVKPSLLRSLRGDREVSDAVITRYTQTLKLNTLTDYQSPGAAGNFFNAIGWTWLVITFTNIMHWVLAKIHLVIPNYGISIILLTVMVRMMMFPLSRKQAMMSLKMQALQPEMKKLAERHKDDPQAKAQEQMKLFRRHGVNPVGSCWVILIQMPIFMGLYFALQESIQFRLAQFWPTWIVNLAAPDMIWEWGRGIPFLSRDSDYGGIFYLGPYLNLLPLFAVALMVVQQQMMMPPPADKEQEMQQKMMRYMMIVMGLFFFKIAAGLCLYIITSTLWGFAERKLLPKAKPIGIDTDLDKRVADMARPTESSSTAVKTEGRKPGRNKRKGADRVKVKDDPKEAGLGQRLSDWWQNVLEQAKKK